MNSVKVIYKHSLGDSDFPDDQMFASLTDLDNVFDILADKCLCYRAGTTFDGEGGRVLYYGAMKGENEELSLRNFLYYLNILSSAKVFPT
jgi:hypothetical protein